MGAACVLKTPQVVPETPASSRVVGSARGAPVCRPFTPACPIRLLERGPRPGLDSVWRAWGHAGGGMRRCCTASNAAARASSVWAGSRSSGLTKTRVMKRRGPASTARLVPRPGSDTDPTSPRSTSASGNHAPPRDDRRLAGGAPHNARAERRQDPRPPQRRGRRPQTSSFSARHDSELHAGSASPIGTGPTARSRAIVQCLACAGTALHLQHHRQCGGVIRVPRVYSFVSFRSQLSLPDGGCAWYRCHLGQPDR